MNNRHRANYRRPERTHHGTKSSARGTVTPSRRLLQILVFLLILSVQISNSVLANGCWPFLGIYDSAWQPIERSSTVFCASSYRSCSPGSAVGLVRSGSQTARPVPWRSYSALGVRWTW